MNTLFARILLWFSVTLLITAFGSAFVAATFTDHDELEVWAPAARLVRFELEQARAAYEHGGRTELQAYLEHLNRESDAQGVLTDASGRDLVTGEDRSRLANSARYRHAFPFIRAGRSMLARPAGDGRYWFFFIVPRPPMLSWFLMPDHVFWILAVALLCYALAYSVTRPLRELQRALERFGSGDRKARMHSTRRDELGELARTFDRMADRITTLLEAERRLLLDISHELRSPLARLGVAVELARSGASLESALNRIQKESDRLNSLVGQLLQVTRAEGDHNLLNRQPVRLDELACQLAGDAAIEATAHKSSVQCHGGGPVTVEGDPELLRRAIENVIRNAIRYAPEGSPVEVSVDRSGADAVVTVRDHGPGVPESSLPRLFDAFYRVDEDRGRTTGGAGLGLSIARRAIELHSGTIEAHNAKPGLEVKILLPERPVVAASH
jgi:signal transduction histidine kinase